MTDIEATNPIAGLKELAPTFALMLVIALGTNAIFGARPLLPSISDGKFLGWQAAVGAGTGLTFSVPIVTAVLRKPLFRGLRDHCVERVRMIDLRGLNPLWVSNFAGVGEKVLFRGAIQPLLGLWVTSALFSLGHVQPSQYRDLRAGTIWYASFVFCVSMLLGIVYSRVGLVAAICFTRPVT